MSQIEEMNKVVDVVETATDMVVNNELDVDAAEIAKVIYKKGFTKGAVSTAIGVGTGVGLAYGGKWLIGKIKKAIDNRKKSSTIVEQQVFVNDAHVDAK